MSDQFIGEIRMFGGNFAPMDWAFCDGQTLQISQNDVLYSLIGTTYGGDGTTTFALPDLRGRLPMHRGNGHVIGEKLGAETVAVTESQMPSHTHPVMANSAVGVKENPQDLVWAAGDDATSSRYATGVPNQAMNATQVGFAGAGMAHDNMMPYLTVSFIIAISGIFPTRS
jgi:microcystin-dependent protein